MDKSVIEMDLRKFVLLNIKFLYFLGYFPPNFKEKYQIICYRVYSVLFIGFVFITCLLTQLGGIAAVFGDLEKMADASFLALTNIAQLFKLYIFVIRTSEIRDLINNINREEFYPRNQQQYKILVNEINVSERNLKIFAYMCFTTCSLWAIFPLLDEKMRLPLGGWFPFDIDKSPMFEIVYLYQYFTAVINGISDVSMDTLLMGFIIVICGELKILNNAFQILKQKFEDNPKNIADADYNVRQDLIRNVEHYKSIIRFADEFTTLFSACIMVQFVITVLISCITFFQLSLIPVASIQFLSMLFYQSAMFLEIYLWCYYGNEVIIQSGKLTESAFMCEWIDCSEDFKNDLLIFMSRSQIPLKLYAGGYFTLSLQTHMAIMKSSWSYFVLLHQVHSQENS